MYFISGCILQSCDCDTKKHYVVTSLHISVFQRSDEIKVFSDSFTSLPQPLDFGFGAVFVVTYFSEMLPNNNPSLLV